jgi:hypothetical protein
MNMSWMCRVIAGVLAIGLVAGARVQAQSSTVAMVDALRGGWVADVEGTRHIFVLKIRDAAVSGIYCAVDCSDPSHLAFVERGTLTPEGLRFQILRIERGVQSRTDVAGRIVDDRLLLWLTPRGRMKRPTQLTLQRDARKPALVTVEEVFSRRGVVSGPLLISESPTPYTPPGPNEPLTRAGLEGLWVWSIGPAKQHFIFRQVDARLLGVVCGPCDNPYSFGPLDNVVIRGDTLTFDINHEDWGLGIDLGPFANHATATLSRHELHVRTVHQPGPRTIEGALTLIGPVVTAAR